MKSRKFAATCNMYYNNPTLSDTAADCISICHNPLVPCCGGGGVSSGVASSGDVTKFNYGKILISGEEGASGSNSL